MNLSPITASTNEQSASGTAFGTAEWLFPRRYQRFCRVLHPIGTDANTYIPWSSIEEQVPGRLHGSVQWHRYTGATEVTADFRGQFRPDRGWLEPKTFGLLLESLSRTSCGNHFIVGYWTGFGDLADCFDRMENEFVICGRPYRLFEITGNLLNLPDAALGMGVHRSPSILYPVDRSWYLRSEIDYDSTIVGSDREEVIDAVLKQPGIESLEISPQTDLTSRGDDVN